MMKRSLVVFKNNLSLESEKGTRMKTHIRQSFRFAFLLSAALALTLVVGVTLADDLNPAPYRGDPLSVFVHWSGDAGLPQQPDWTWVDDSDPSTYLFPEFLPHFSIIPDPTGLGTLYEFIIPNIVDELPLKLLRIQLTWVGPTSAPPLGVDGVGIDGGNSSAGVVTHASSPSVHTQPPGGYQFFDIEFRPNPDFEILRVNLPPGAELVQVVIDSISTIPEPATMGLLVCGGAVMVGLRNRKRA